MRHPASTVTKTQTLLPGIRAMRFSIEGIFLDIFWIIWPLFRHQCGMHHSFYFYTEDQTILSLSDICFWCFIVCPDHVRLTALKAHKSDDIYPFTFRVMNKSHEANVRCVFLPVELREQGSRNHHLIKWKPVRCQTMTSWMKPSVCFYFVLKYWWWIIASLTCVIRTLDGEILCFSVSQWSHPSSIHNILRFYFSEVSKHPRYMKHFRGSGGWVPLTA